jgi:hypothetical protein
MKHHRLLAVSAFLMLAIPVAHAADTPPEEQIQDRFSQMQTLMDQARQAKTPEERQKLITEHMKMMQEQMSSIDAVSPKIGTISQGGMMGQGRVMGQGKVMGPSEIAGQGRVLGPSKDSNTMDLKPPPPILTMQQRMDMMQRMMGQMIQEQQMMMKPAQ